MVAVGSHSTCFLFLFLFFLSPCCFSVNAEIVPTKLVDSICQQTSHYKFCVDSVYADPRASEAHDYVLLAYISFGAAYLNSSNTQSYIQELLLNESYSSPRQARSLQRCRGDYKKAVNALEEAYNNLNSETYFDLAQLAGSASHGAAHCQHSIRIHGGRKVDGVPLKKRNRDLKSLCEICVVISKHFSSS